MMNPDSCSTRFINAFNAVANVLTSQVESQSLLPLCEKMMKLVLICRELSTTIRQQEVNSCMVSVNEELLEC